MNIIWAVATHQGRVRQNNEDSAHPANSGRSSQTTVLMVADGMGGHVGGEIASRLAVEAAATDQDISPQERVEAANGAILAEIARRPDLAGMGTTLTLVEFQPSGLLRFAHIGDSRAYLLRQGELVMLTVDHTVVAEYMRAGSISEEEAAAHPQRSMLTKALGVSTRPRPDIFEMAPVPGDRLLLCSDGVTNMLDDRELADRLGTGTAEEAAWGLVEDANRAGGLDNITALVIDLVEPTSA